MPRQANTKPPVRSTSPCKRSTAAFDASSFQKHVQSPTGSGFFTCQDGNGFSSPTGLLQYTNNVSPITSTTASNGESPSVSVLKQDHYRSGLQDGSAQVEPILGKENIRVKPKSSNGTASTAATTRDTCRRNFRLGFDPKDISSLAEKYYPAHEMISYESLEGLLEQKIKDSSNLVVTAETTKLIHKGQVQHYEADAEWKRDLDEKVERQHEDSTLNQAELLNLSTACYTKLQRIEEEISSGSKLADARADARAANERAARESARADREQAKATKARADLRELLKEKARNLKENERRERISKKSAESNGAAVPETERRKNAREQHSHTRSEEGRTEASKARATKPNRRGKVHLKSPCK